MNLNISLGALLRRFWKKTMLTWILVILEAVILLAMPLVMGWAVDDLIIKKNQGILQLATLCFLLLVIGAGRRFYDTRVYSGIYTEVSNEMVSRENQRQTPLSKVSARVTLFTEFIEFLENRWTPWPPVTEPS